MLALVDVEVWLVGRCLSGGCSALFALLNVAALVGLAGFALCGVRFSFFLSGNPELSWGFEPLLECKFCNRLVTEPPSSLPGFILFVIAFLWEEHSSDSQSTEVRFNPPLFEKKKLTSSCFRPVCLCSTLRP